MNNPRLGLSLMAVIATAVLFGPDVVIADEATVVERASEFDEHVVAKGRATWSERPSVTVSIADLNLDNEQGAATLYRRLRHAAEAVCEVPAARASGCLKTQRLADECYEITLSNAVKNVNSELVTGLHKG